MSEPTESIYQLDRRAVAAAFGAAARVYEDKAVLHKTVAQRLIERLDLMRIQPQVILDAGSGPGFAARALARRFGKAQIVLLDLAPAMLIQARRQAPWLRSRERYVAADMQAIPLADHSMDLVYSNLALQWCNDLDRAFAEFRRVLKPEGLLLLSSLGPDTLTELRQSWAQADPAVHVHAFMDMHDVGDAMIRAGFSSPLMDQERFTLTYADAAGLMRDLKGLGARNASGGRPRGLTGRQKLAEVERAYEGFRRDGVLPATYEVVYGHAWAPTVKARPQDGSTVASFPLNQLRRRPRPTGTGSAGGR